MCIRDSYSAEGAYAQAIGHARHWLAVDPLREEAHRWLMQLHAATGARDAALRQYREAVRILDEELGVGPLPETTALYEAIQEGRIVPAVVPPRPASAPPTPTAPALIGRESAWDTLLAAYADVGTTGRLLAVTGEAGAGQRRPGGRLAGGPRTGRTGRRGEVGGASMTGALRAAGPDDAVQGLLQAFGIPVPPFAVATNREDAIAAAERIGYPVVLKVLSPDVSHKSDVDGVRLNLRDAQSVGPQYDDILEALRRHLPQARATGVLVQAMVERRHGRELMIGVVTDPAFGPAISFGSGGVAVLRWMVERRRKNCMRNTRLTRLACSSIPPTHGTLHSRTH